MTGTHSSDPTLFARAAEYRIAGIALPSPPVVSATSVLFDSAARLFGVNDALLAKQGDRLDTSFQYGAISTPTVDAVASAIARIEGGSAALLTPSGQSAILLTVAQHARRDGTLLALDTLTYSTRALLEDLAQRMHFRLVRVGVDALDALDLTDVGAPFALFAELPGGFGFEVPDIDGLLALARRAGVPIIVDNTWSSSVFLHPLALGADFVVLSMSKLYGGPAGVGLGAVVARDPAEALKLRSLSAMFGLNVAPDAAARLSLCLGTLALRARAQDAATRAIMQRIGRRGAGYRLLHPALPEHPSHARWKAWFSGACSAFSIAFEGTEPAALARALSRARLFRAAYGWGGTSSSYYPFDPSGWRLASSSTFRGRAFVRIYVGLEDADELAQDLEAVLANAIEGAP